MSTDTKVTLARVAVGDVLRTNIGPAGVYPDAMSTDVRTVADKTFRRAGAGEMPGKLWTLVFTDGTVSEPRYGTTTHYRVADVVPITDVMDQAAALYAAEVEKLSRAIDGDPWNQRRVEVHAVTGPTRDASGRVVPVILAPVERDRPEGITDAEHAARAAVEADQPAPADGERCEPCKGFGLVRAIGKRAGGRYKTLAGAQAAQAAGRAADCPECLGLGLSVHGVRELLDA